MTVSHPFNIKKAPIKMIDVTFKLFTYITTKGGIFIFLYIIQKRQAIFKQFLVIPNTY